MGQSEVTLSHMNKRHEHKDLPNSSANIPENDIQHDFFFPSQIYFHFKRPVFLKESFSFVLPIKQNYFLHQNHHELLIILNLQNKGGDV